MSPTGLQSHHLARNTYTTANRRGNFSLSPNTSPTPPQQIPLCVNGVTLSPIDNFSPINVPANSLASPPASPSKNVPQVPPLPQNASLGDLHVYIHGLKTMIAQISDEKEKIFEEKEKVAKELARKLAQHKRNDVFVNNILQHYDHRKAEIRDLRGQLAQAMKANNLGQWSDKDEGPETGKPVATSYPTLQQRPSGFGAFVSQLIYLLTIALLASSVAYGFTVVLAASLPAASTQVKTILPGMKIQGMTIPPNPDNSEAPVVPMRAPPQATFAGPQMARAVPTKIAQKFATRQENEEAMIFAPTEKNADHQFVSAAPVVKKRDEQFFRKEAAEKSILSHQAPDSRDLNLQQHQQNYQHVPQEQAIPIAPARQVVQPPAAQVDAPKNHHEPQPQIVHAAQPEIQIASSQLSQPPVPSKQVPQAQEPQLHTQNQTQPLVVKGQAVVQATQGSDPVIFAQSLAVQQQAAQTPAAQVPAARSPILQTNIQTQMGSETAPEVQSAQLPAPQEFMTETQQVPDAYADPQRAPNGQLASPLASNASENARAAPQQAATHVHVVVEETLLPPAPHSQAHKSEPANHNELHPPSYVTYRPHLPNTYAYQAAHTGVPPHLGGKSPLEAGDTHHDEKRRGGEAFGSSDMDPAITSVAAAAVPAVATIVATEASIASAIIAEEAATEIGLETSSAAQYPIIVPANPPAYTQPETNPDLMQQQQQQTQSTPSQTLIIENLLPTLTASQPAPPSPDQEPASGFVPQDSRPSIKDF